MATDVQQKPCAGCQNGMVTCNGCENRFCLPHLNEHLQQIQKGMDEVVQEHDQLLDALNSQVTVNQLMSRINEWEQQSFEKVKDTAQQARIDLQASLDRTKHQLVISLGNMTKQLKSSQASNAYAEKEIDGWLRQLEQLRQMLEKPVNIETVEDDAMHSAVRMIKVVEKPNTEINPTSYEAVAQSRAPAVTPQLGN